MTADQDQASNAGSESRARSENSNSCRTVGEVGLDRPVQPAEAQPTPRTSTNEWRSSRSFDAPALAWVDEGYRARNPWYGQARRKPVFSLGTTLPHTVARSLEASLRGSVGLEADDDLEQRATRELPQSKPQRQVAKSRSQETFEARTGGGRSEGSSDRGRGDGDKKGEDVLEGGDRGPEELRNWWARLRAKHPEPLAEFLCTFISVLLGLCATLSVNLSSTQTTHYGSYETACWAWGFALMFGIYLGGGVSGAHMNPCMSVTLSVFRGFPWRSCAVYCLVQFLASVAAGGVAYAVYRDAIHHLDPDRARTWTSFVSAPQPWVSVGCAFASQTVASAVMVVAVFALGDDQNNPPGAGMHALIIGLLSTMLKFAFGYNTGSSLNPAMDVGPRLVALWAGYRTPRLFGDGWWVYGPWLGTLLGSFIGALVYDGLVFTGSESPVNYRLPETVCKRLRVLRRTG